MGKTALVTGGSGGIGKAIAIELAKSGYKIAIVGRNQTKLDKAVAEIKKIGTETYGIQADLLHKNAPKDIIEKVSACSGQLNVLVNCAGLSKSGDFTEVSVEEWDRIFIVNARAPFFICREALPLLKKAKKAIVINIASVVGFKGYIHQSVYSSSKHALTGFTKVFAKEVQPFGIRVHLISPGGVATEMVTKMRPDINTKELIKPEEIADIVHYIINCKGNGTIDQFYIRRYSGLAFD